MSSWIPQKGFAKKLLDLPLSNFPSLWEDFADQLSDLTQNKNITVYEEKNDIIVEASLPGLKADEIDIHFENGYLTIQGEQKEEEKSKDRKYFRREVRSYSYRTRLPENVDESLEPKASYKDGVLKISFNKLKSSKSKKIAIKNG